MVSFTVIVIILIIFPSLNATYEKPLQLCHCHLHTPPPSPPSLHSSPHPTSSVSLNPVRMAFALLTSVAPVYGLYTSFFPVVLYMLFGTGRHVSTGTFAVISLMTGSVVESLVPRPMGMNITNIQEAEIEKQRIAVASAVTLLSGLIMIAMFVLQLGVLSTYLSDPIVKAFTSGAAFHVTVSQLSTMLGLRLPRFTGLSTIFKVRLVISVVCLSVLIPTKEINSRFRRKLRIPIPIEIIMVSGYP
uniref:Solute carrier family 26 member 10 n=1 Tax=Callorhinchus milii TaxID=7868 RepID=A0A4W3IUW4_CALMI